MKSIFKIKLKTWNWWNTKAEQQQQQEIRTNKRAVQHLDCVQCAHAIETKNSAPFTIFLIENWFSIKEFFFIQKLIWNLFVTPRKSANLAILWPAIFPQKGSMGKDLLSGGPSSHILPKKRKKVSENRGPVMAHIPSNVWAYVCEYEFLCQCQLWNWI